MMPAEMLGAELGERCAVPLAPAPAGGVGAPALDAADRPSLAMLGSGERWYCLMTQPRRETWALANLERQGFRPFLPLIARTVRHARRTQSVQGPLFPRYAFVALDLARERWRSVNGTAGVVGLIMEADRPRPVPVGVVEQLLALAGPDGSVRYGLEVTPGQRVRILTGPLADRLATVTRLDEKGRVALLLEILGAERPVVMRREELLPLP